MPKSPDEPLHCKPEWRRTTLSKIGDAVITTDTAGRVTFLNQAAETLTGWTQAEAEGVPLEEVFKIVNLESRMALENPALQALREGVNIGLPNRALLIAKNGVERPIGPIDDCAAPICNEHGERAGAVLVFRDISEMYRQERALQAALDYADKIIATLREPFVVLDDQLRVKTANRAFYQKFRVTPDETQGRYIYELGNGQWNIPRLRTLLDEVLASENPILDFDMEHDFPAIGRKFMLLNAVRCEAMDEQPGLILLAIEDITERKRTEVALEIKNERLYLLWEMAGVLLSADTSHAMLQGLLVRIGPQIGVDAYLSQLLEDDGQVLQLSACDGVPTSVLNSFDRIPLGQGVCGVVAQHRQSQTITHIQQSDAPQLALFRELGFRAFACNPLLSDNRLLGTLSFASRTKDAFDSDELAFLETTSHHVALAYAKLQAQAEVRVSEVRFRFIMDSIPQKIVTTKPKGDVDYYNPQWMEFTGLTFEQIKDWGWMKIVHPLDLAEHLRAWRAALSTGERFEFESRFCGADGQYRWHICRALPMRDDEGRIVMWVGSCTDVHDIKLVEMALVDSEVRYRRLFETAKDGILILDTQSGHITDANAFMSELLGYSHQHFLGRELWEIGLFADKAANETAVRTLQESGYIRYEHLPLQTSSGKLVEVEVIANTYQEHQQQVIQCNIRDITERSLLEKKMQEQAAALADLHRRKDEFLAMLSHELRNPLAPIASAVQLLSLQPHDNPLQKQAHAIIERQVGKLTRLVDDLLEVSRITTGRIHLQLELVELGSVVRRALESARPMIKQHQHHLELVIPPAADPLWVRGDFTRLEQVVVNLLANAAKYTPAGGQITLQLQREGNEAVLRVQDSGVGIAPELLPQIFDLFTQAERSLDRSQGGLGVGLCLVQRLVEMHGGRVDVTSVLGQGSVFVVRLPTIATPDPEPRGAFQTAVAAPKSSLRVLVVDDNVDAAELLGMLLEKTGHHFQMTHDGLSALEAAEAYQPHIVLLDIGLPGIDGYEVARRLRLQPQNSHVVLVAMTGYGQESDKQKSQEAGFNHHLVKPADFATVQQILAEVSFTLI